MKKMKSPLEQLKVRLLLYDFLISLSENSNVSRLGMFFIRPRKGIARVPGVFLSNLSKAEKPVRHTVL